MSVALQQPPVNLPSAPALQPQPALQPAPDLHPVPVVSTLPAIPGDASNRRRWRGPVRWLLFVLLIAGGAALYFWKHTGGTVLPAGIVSSNGRLEATEIDIATKLAGRISEVLVQEGDFVERGQIVARMDTNVLQAQFREAQADANRAKMALATANAVVDQRRNELTLAQSILRRSKQLVDGHFISVEKLDSDQAQFNVASATLTAAVSQVSIAKAALQAAGAAIERIQADIDDSVLRAPTAGRAQYRLAQPGEVLPAGGKVIGMLDLADVYMTLFLPEDSAGRLAIGSEARLVFDAAPQYVVPARITFVATEAQFTPKTVETATERQKLVFRIKAQLDPDLLRKHWTQVKAGVPGTGYVRVNPASVWPQTLAIRLPAP
ncbi:MAG: HlyD family efflux transporter periplasmic adaptor subunit [Proteobacteria bacterium]|nr:HlyD family efflux transporter periplasmic adaptor subunit [Pseudomonadota bacterium]